jgi:hypothetical protein
MPPVIPPVAAVRVKVKGSLELQDYEVQLREDGQHRVFAVVRKRPLRYGYNYAAGHERLLRTIKPHGAIWRRAVRAAWVQVMDDAKVYPEEQL